MKKNFTKEKYQSRKMLSKSLKNKLSVSLSLNGTNKLILNNKNQNTNKETISGTYENALTSCANLESSNSSRVNFSKNNLDGNQDNKLLVISSSLNGKKSFPSVSNFCKNSCHKIYSEKVSICEGDFSEYSEEDTNKIDFRYQKIPVIETKKKENNNYWLATYDKLMKKSKIIKILNYYIDSLSQRNNDSIIEENFNNNYKEIEYKKKLKSMNDKFNFKEKTMIIEGYEIYYIKKHKKPFVRQKKGGKLFIKLYLLTFEQINQIFSYINRVGYKQYLNVFDSTIEKNSFIIINNLNKTIYNYSKIFFLGSFMNINIYLFSHTIKKNSSGNIKDITSYNNINDLPPSNKIAKLVKILMINFPNFSKKFFIDYLMKPKYNNIDISINDSKNLLKKMQEVSSLLITNKKSKFLSVNIANKNNIIRKVINSIPVSTTSFQNRVSNRFRNLRKSIINSSLSKDLDQISKKNCEISKKLFISDCLSNSKNKIDTKQNKSNNNKKKILKRIKSSNKKRIKTTENNKNKSLIKTKRKTKDFQTVSVLSKNKKKKFLTRNNSIKDIKKIKNINTFQNNKKKIYDKSYLINKENNQNIFNLNLLKENNKNGLYNNYDINYNLNITNKIIETDFMKQSTRYNFKSLKNKCNLYKTNKTNNTNIKSINKDFEISKKNELFKSRQPIKLLSTIKKVISQKMNNISENSNSNFGLESDSNNAIPINIIGNNQNNNENSKNKIVKNCDSSNKNKNNNGEYINRVKKNLFYDIINNISKEV